MTAAAADGPAAIWVDEDGTPLDRPRPLSPVCWVDEDGTPLDGPRPLSPLVAARAAAIWREGVRQARARAARADK